MYKQIQKLRLIAIALILVAISSLSMAQAVGDEFTSGVLKYKITKLDPAEVEVCRNDSILEGDIKIPATVKYNNKDYSVVSIGDWCFADFTSLTSVSISNSVKIIGICAFKGCESLSSLTIPNSVILIRMSAFKGCTSLISIEIPNSVTSIVLSAFEGCSSLISINIPSSVTKIEGWLFKNCTSLISVTIPNSVTSLESCVFEGCSSLISIEIPNSVTSIGLSAFKDCSSLISINIPNSVTSLDDSVFKGCSSLISVTIPNSLTKLGGWLFEDCTSLASVIIPNSVTSIDYHAFYGCTSLGLITIPNSVTSISQQAFGCENLTTIKSHITDPSKVTLKERVFDKVNKQTSTLLVPKGKKVLYQNAEQWKEFENIIEQEYVNPLLGKKFKNGNLYYKYISFKPNKVVVVPQNYTEPYWNNNEKPKGDLNIQDTITQNGEDFIVTSIEEFAFSSCDSLNSVTIPNSVISIGRGAFEECDSLKSVYCKIKNISSVPLGKNVFSGVNENKCILYVPTGKVSDYKEAEQWKNFTNIMEPDDNYPLIGTKFKNGDLYYKYVSFRPHKVALVMQNSKYPNWNNNEKPKGDLNIHDTIIQNGENFEVIGIEDMVFDNCNELTSVTIPNSIKSIGYKAFDNLNLLVIISKIENPSVLSLGSFIFNSSIYQTATLIVPNGTKDLYQNAEQWKDFAQIIEKKDYNPLLGKQFKNGDLYYKYISFQPNKVVVTPQNLTEPYWNKDEEPKGDININSTIIQNGEQFTVTSIENHSFYDCDLISSVTIPNSVHSVKWVAFVGCYHLNKIIIPNSVTSIDQQAFDSKNISLIISHINNPNAVSLQKYVFWNLNKQTTTLVVPNGTKALYQKAEQWKEFENIKEQKEIIKVQSISLNTKSTELTIGETFTLEATITPYNALNKKITWSSVNEEIAKVDNNGTVIALSVGSTKIIATTEDGGFSATCDVTVNSTVGITENLTQSITIYPTIVQKGFIIKTKEPQKVLEIYTLTGKKEKTVQLISTEQYVNVSGLGQGVYILKVGKEVFKIIKH